MHSTVRYAYKRVYEGVNGRLRTIGGGRWAAHCRPISIVILLTELCNARCVHCDIWKNRGKENAPTLEQWKTVLRDLREWLGPVQVTFSGGEALLVPYATDLVSYGSSQGLFMELLTHGYWFDDARIEKLARALPWRVTISLDGVGETHSRIRGRENFFERTDHTIQMLCRLRREHGLDFSIRLKTVIMEHNLNSIGEVPRYARQFDRTDVFFQPIEQNYNTQEDPRWFESSQNWPKNPDRAVEAVRQLIRMKGEGFPIANSFERLGAMIPYFEDPDAHRISTQSHAAHEQKVTCSALTMLQFQANGDVTICASMKPVGNVKQTPIREIWEKRPRFWEQGCCMEWRCSPAEKQQLALPIVS